MGVSLVFLQLIVFFFHSFYIQEVLPRFLLGVLDGTFFLKHLQMYTLNVLLDGLNLLEAESLIGLVVVAVLVERVNVLDLLDFEAVVERLDTLQLPLSALNLVLYVREVARTLQLVLPHLQLYPLHRKHLKLLVIHSQLVV